MPFYQTYRLYHTGAPACFTIVPYLRHYWHFRFTDFTFLSALQVLPSPSFRHLVSRRIAQCINGPINQCVSKRTDQSMYESLVESIGESPNGRRYEWRRLVSHTSHFLHFGALTGITVLPFSGGSRGFYRSSASKQAARQIREFKNGPLDISIVESAQEPANDSSANLRLS